MGLTSSLFTGLSGMKTNEFRMDVIGNNIANVNTYGYKSSRASFQTQFYNSFSFGSAASSNSGGTNPRQIGTGSSVSSITRDFSGGAPETTGIKTDLSIQGKGMFILEQQDGGHVYTRDGSFQLNSESYLMSADGYFLQGYSVDSNFNIVEGTLSRLRLPVGEITTSEATSEASFSGDLNGGGDIATARSELGSQGLVDGGAAAAGAGTALTDLRDAATPGVTLLDNGNIITLSDASKGGARLPEKSFTVGVDGTTLGDFTTWLEDVLGITTLGHDPNLVDLTGSGVPNPGITIDGVTGAITVVGNLGTANEIELGTGAITVAQGSGAAPPSTAPLSFTSSASASGESIRTSFRAYDSIGNPIDVNVTMVMEEKDSNGIRWRYFAECGEDTDADRVVGSGTVSFDNLGHYIEGTDPDIQVTLDDTGAVTPQTITLDFSTMDGYAMTNSMTLLSQNGFQAGTLRDFTIDSEGVIIGAFSNGLSRQLGQVVLATFRNTEGLVSESDNIWTTGPNSGDPTVKKPLELGAGSINSAALELSNVDLSREFINLIVSSTGFSAASRVIQTSDQLLNELIMLTR